jgi:hypothetical protein
MVEAGKAQKGPNHSMLDYYCYCYYCLLLLFVVVVVVVVVAFIRIGYLQLCT